MKEFPPQKEPFLTFKDVKLVGTQIVSYGRFLCFICPRSSTDSVFIPFTRAHSTLAAGLDICFRSSLWRTHFVGMRRD